MMYKFWQYFLIRLLVGWAVVAVLPALVLFWDIITNSQVELSLWLSILAGLIMVLLGLTLSEKLAHFPSQNPFYLTVIVLLMLSMGVFLVFFAFRLPYSVYYFALSVPLLWFFCFFSQSLLQSHSKQVIAYIPSKRTKNLLSLNKVSWMTLPHDDYMPNGRYSAVVADLSDTNVQENWSRKLAYISISGTPVWHVLQAQESLTGRIAIYHVHENQLGSLSLSPIYVFLKRCLDIGIVISALPIVLPIMIITYIMIKLDSEGDAIFVQERVGLGGKAFKMYKFRSMTANAKTSNQVMTQINDDRITKVGKIIRKWRIDELPQLWNILKGDMSLIGPRPELPNMVIKQEAEIPFYIYRQLVKPGLSGWAQVMQGGDHVENIATKLEYDFYYIKNASLTLDLLIVIKTIQAILTGFGAR